MWRQTPFEADSVPVFLQLNYGKLRRRTEKRFSQS